MALSIPIDQLTDRDHANGVKNDPIAALLLSTATRPRTTVPVQAELFQLLTEPAMFTRCTLISSPAAQRESVQVGVKGEGSGVRGSLSRW